LTGHETSFLRKRKEHERDQVPVSGQKIVMREKRKKSWGYYYTFAWGCQRIGPAEETA